MATSKIETINGTPLLMFNGSPVAPMIYRGGGDGFEATLRMLAQGGFHICTCDLPGQWWCESEQEARKGQEEADRFLERLLAIDKDFLILVAIGVEPPEWWKERNPGQVVVWKEGQTCGRISMASERWKQEVAAPLESYVRRLEERWGDHIIGYQPCAGNTGEWYHQYWPRKDWELTCFEEVFAVGFRKWLATRYGAIESLNSTWQTAHRTFDDIALPTATERWSAKHGVFRLPREEAPLIDFTRYQNVCILDAIHRVCQAIKKGCDYRKITVLFYGYVSELCGTENGYGIAPLGHCMLDEFLRDPNMDVVMACYSYFDRGPGGSMPVDGPVDSVVHRGKAWDNEDDMRTHLCAPDTLYGRCDTPDQTRWNHIRNFARNLVHRSFMSFFDFNRGWLNDSAIVENVCRLNDIYQDFCSRPSPFESDVAVFVDEESQINLAYDAGWMYLRPAIYHMRAQYNRIGATPELWLQSDCVAGMAPIRPLTVFLNAFHLTARQLRAIRQRLEGSGATVVWFYAPGYIVDGQLSVATMKELTGFELVVESEDKSVLVSTEGLDSPLLEGLGRKRFPDDGDTWLWDGFNRAPMPANYCRDQNDFYQGPFEDVGKHPEARYINPRFSIDPRQAGNEVIARFTDGKIAIARRPEAGFTSIYVGTIWVPAKLLANIASTAGCHLYTECGDVVITDGRCLSLTACTAGQKEIQLRKPSAVTDLMSGETVAQQTERFSVQMARDETRLFLIQTEDS